MTTPLPRSESPTPPSAPHTGPDTGPDSAALWSVELDRLEVELLWAERLLKAAAPLDASGWTPREGLAPLPEHLVPRAREIQSRQQHLIAKLGHQLAQLAQRQRRESVQRPAALDSAPAPRYLDVAG